MSNTLAADALSAATDRAPGGRFAKGNLGGPGNPFARQTAALRAYLINHVTERDLQDILDILLLNAKGGHLPSVKLLFAYVLGKPKPVVEPDLLDLQELLMFQQSAQPPEALETLCDQLPLDFQVRLTRHAQADNAATAVQTARDHEPAGTTAPKVLSGAPSTNGDFGTSPVAERPQPPSTNGEIRRRSRPPRLAGFDWLGELRRAFGSLSPP
jgi:hypothetical protein